ncbi:uncharacterized protein [Physcomitrium patens]|uniref:Uncharacterized protein n=1 Tax=Physcomitrium patens TaxID=3218 RepID=A9S111_PHYPA|nr:uncharacterized protein LOC112273045 [Physcomitrium patens]PNR33428.1 hypothetical protein PHYPA_025372 [Physcomitrium patens]|eukprot:XP_024357149.1 uncharacterized protein LOC112273045 [Physcomitrella patens]
MAVLEGKVALITGASSGLGREFALSLSKNGANVILAARRKNLLDSLCDEINALANQSEGKGPRSGKAVAIELDVSASEPVIDAAVEKAWAALGYIDVLVNNAGLRGPVRTPIDQEEHEWNAIFNTNLRGTWLMSKAVSKRLVAAKRGGSIINISSIGGIERGLLPGGLAYSTSKAAVIHLSKIMAMELGHHNIRTNAIAAGLFKSEITNDLFQKEWLHKVATKIVPAGKWGAVDPDLTSLVILLASDDSQYITGNTFIVDGGQSLPGLPIWSSL